MAKEIVTQRMKMTCEGCGKSQEWEMVGADQNPIALQEMMGWYAVGRKIIDRGQMLTLSADACSLDCVKTAAEKLYVPVEEEQPDRIDLSSLRIN